MLHCEDVRPEFSAFLDRELPRWKIHVIRWHLFRCPECAAEMALIQQTDQFLRGAPAQVASPELLTQIIDRAESERREKPLLYRAYHSRWMHLRDLMRRHVFVPVLASCLLVFVGFSLFARTSDQKAEKQEDNRVVRVDLLLDQPVRGYILSGW